MSSRIDLATCISITLLPPAPRHLALRAHQVVIELADRLDRLLQFLVIVEPATNLGNAFAAQAELANPSASLAHGEHMHLVPFTARALGAATLMSNHPLKQRAAQQLTRDWQLVDKLVARLKGSIANHSL